MNVDDVYVDEKSGISITFIGVSVERKHIAVFSVEDKKGRFELKNLGIAKNTSISMENFTGDKENLVINVVDVLESSPYGVTLSLHSSPTLREFLTCKDNGYETIIGWKNTRGDILPVFDLDEYDDAGKVQKATVENYLPLNKYLTDGYPWYETFDKFYATGACMWREYERKNQDAVTQALSVVNKYKNMATGSKTNYTNEILEFFGNDFKMIARKYGWI